MFPAYMRLSVLILFTYSSSADLVVNVQQYGAIPDGVSDSTSSFLSAWRDACNSVEPATIYVPPGGYLLGSMVFEGKSCLNSATTIRIDGTLLAPLDYEIIGSSKSWLKFHQVSGVSIFGGTIEGRGSNLWACKNSDKDCPHGATLLAFYSSRNIFISGLTSLNSQMFHILIHGSQAVILQGLIVLAPGDSPNTDGIHVQLSSDVTILDTRVGTGDDCISIGPGNSNLLIQNVLCGPGHGISIGSLGWEMDEPGVQNVTVRGVKFIGTTNGVRVKTWARPSNGFVRNVIFQHLLMDNVENPILIDQNYCPHHHCPKKDSGVKISDITYQDIHGTSTTEAGIQFDCSDTNPCSIRLEDVSLSYQDQPAKAYGANVQVEGVDVPLGTMKPSGYGGLERHSSAAAPSNRWQPRVFSIVDCWSLFRLVVLLLVVV